MTEHFMTTRIVGWLMQMQTHTAAWNQTDTEYDTYMRNTANQFTGINQYARQ